MSACNCRSLPSTGIPFSNSVYALVCVKYKYPKSSVNPELVSIKTSMFSIFFGSTKETIHFTKRDCNATRADSSISPI